MGLKILVADDATFVRDTLKRGLRQLIPDLEFYEAVDGKRAISALKANHVDLIFSDWEMPELSGDQLLNWVREQEKYQKTPFIMVTSRGDRDNVVKAVQSGVSDYMTKPFSPEELHRKVSKQLKRIGYKPSKKPASQHTAMSSLQVLTAGNNADNTNQTSQQKPAKKTTGGTSKVGKNSYPCRATLRFADFSSACAISDLNLQALNAFVVRQDRLPNLFEQTVVDLDDKSGSIVGRLNAYVHSLIAMENNPETKKIKICVRFVDNDPDKMALISKMITGVP